MIQFNLLPDVKQQYIRTQRTKRLVVGVSLIVSAAALLVFLLLMSSVYLIQKKSINDLNRDIKTASTQLKSRPNIGDILTVQQQLESLSGLHSQKPAVSRLFSYLSELTPTNVTISDIHVDFTLNTVSIGGNAPGLDAVNTFVDGLKYTSYTVSDTATTGSAFSTVVLTNFSRDSQQTTYTITFNFNPIIFNNAHTVNLSIGGQPLPDQPSIIFKKEG